MGTNPRTVHTLSLTHTVQNSSLQTNGGAQVHVWTWGTRYSENFTLENPSKFSSRSRENGTKKLIYALKTLLFPARFARKSLEMHKTSTFCIILRVDFGRKQSNVSFYRFNFEKFCVSFFNVSFYRVIILVVHFWKKKPAYGVYHFTGWSFYRGNLLKFSRPKCIILLGDHFTG